MTIIDFSDTNAVCLFTITLFAIVFSRYVIISGLFYILFYSLFKDRFWHRKISSQLRPQGQHWQEVKWSALTSAIFALSGVALIWLWQKDYTAIYIALSLSHPLSSAPLVLPRFDGNVDLISPLHEHYVVTLFSLRLQLFATVKQPLTV